MLNINIKLTKIIPSSRFYFNSCRTIYDGKFYFTFVVFPLPSELGIYKVFEHHIKVQNATNKIRFFWAPHMHWRSRMLRPTRQIREIDTGVLHICMHACVSFCCYLHNLHVFFFKFSEWPLFYWYNNWYIEVTVFPCLNKYINT